MPLNFGNRKSNAQPVEVITTRDLAENSTTKFVILSETGFGEQLIELAKIEPMVKVKNDDGKLEEKYHRADYVLRTNMSKPFVLEHNGMKITEPAYMFGGDNPKKRKTPFGSSTPYSFKIDRITGKPVGNKEYLIPVLWNVTTDDLGHALNTGTPAVLRLSAFWFSQLQESIEDIKRIPDMKLDNGMTVGCGVEDTQYRVCSIKKADKKASGINMYSLKVEEGSMLANEQHDAAANLMTSINDVIEGVYFKYYKNVLEAEKLEDSLNTRFENGKITEEEAMDEYWMFQYLNTAKEVLPQLGVPVNDLEDDDILARLVQFSSDNYYGNDAVLSIDANFFDDEDDDSDDVDVSADEDEEF